MAVSIDQSWLTGSLPEADRANTTREPSGDTVTLRGSPNVSRWVRACCRGKVSVMCFYSDMLFWSDNVEDALGVEIDRATHELVGAHGTTELCVCAFAPGPASVGEDARGVDHLG